MKITDIKVRKIIPEGKMRGIVSVTFDDMFVVHDIKIIESQDKLFVAMPSRKNQDGEFKDIVHPINQEMRDMIQNEILKIFNEAILKEQSSELSETYNNIPEAV